MPDMSRIMHPEAERLIPENLADYVRQNVTGGAAEALGDRLLDAEIMWRYFCRRDEMNAEVHNSGAPAANVRYSPITIAAERVVGWLAKLYYGEDVDYHTAMVATGEGGVPVLVPYRASVSRDEMPTPSPSADETHF